MHLLNSISFNCSLHTAKKKTRTVEFHNNNITDIGFLIDDLPIIAFYNDDNKIRPPDSNISLCAMFLATCDATY